MAVEKCEDGAMKHITPSENILEEPDRLLALPVELLEKIVSFMIVAVGIEDTTALRSTSKALNQEVVKAFFRDGHITASTFPRAPPNTYITYITWKLNSPTTKEMEMQVIVDAAVKMYQRLICLHQQPSAYQREKYAKILFRSVADLASARGGELNFETQDGAVQEALIVQAVFILAAALDDTITMRHMLKAGVKIDDNAKHFAPALWTACREGARNSVDVLLDLGADIHCGRETSEPFEILQLAIQEGLADIVHQLFEYCEYNKTVIEQAYMDAIRNSIKDSRPELAEAIFDHAYESILSGSAFNQLDELEDGCSETDYSWTICYEYHEDTGDADFPMSLYTVSSLEDRRITQSASALFKKTCIAAVRYGSSEALAMSHERSIAQNVNHLKWAKYEGILIFLAAKYGQIKCMETLFELSENRRRFDAGLAAVVLYRRYDMAKLLLKNGVDVNFVHPLRRKQTYRTALTVAAHNNDCKMLEILLDHGVNFKVQVEGLLVWNERRSSMQWLYSSQPQGMFALHLAHTGKNGDAVDFLLAAGAKFEEPEAVLWPAKMPDRKRTVSKYDSITELLKQLRG